MLHVVYLMHPSGVCLLDQKFGEIELDSTLVAGFFSAIREFARMISKGRGDARIVEMGEFYITYAAGDYIVIAAVVDKEDNRLQVLQALDKVIERFSDRFEDTLKSWDGKLVFFSFTPELNKMLNNGFIGKDDAPQPKLKRGLPKLMVKLGQISELEYNIAKQCDGKKTPPEIAKTVGLPQDDVEVLLYRLNKLDLIE
ncbi:MAG: hypothetical protein ACFFDU_06840 [Candidatus Thorarchaeota archaeon]